MGAEKSRLSVISLEEIEIYQYYTSIKPIIILFTVCTGPYKVSNPIYKGLMGFPIL